MFAAVQLLGIVLVNLVPLGGVLFFGWSIFEVIFLYWFENVAIWASHFLKMKLAEKANPTAGTESQANFFAMHYGMFTFVHGIFVVALFGVVMEGFVNYRGGIEGPVFAVFIWQFASLVLEYGAANGFKGVKSEDLMFQPYPRMIALHITIIAAGWLIGEAGSPVWTLVILVVLKTVGDVLFQIFQFKGGPGNVVVSLRKKDQPPPH